MTVCGQLKEMVNAYLEIHPNVSLNGIAKKSGVGATTIRRIMSDSIKNEPAPHTILNLVSVLTKEKRLFAIIEKAQGPLKKVLEDTFGVYVTESMPHARVNELDNVLANPQLFIVYKLAANRVGTSREEILENFGSQGERHIQTLFEKDLICEKDGKIHAIHKDFALDPDVLLRNIPELLKFYKSQEVDQGNNFLFSMSESLSGEAIQKIKEIQKEALKKIYNIVKSPYYEGDIPFFLVSCQDTMKAHSANGVYK